MSGLQQTYAGTISTRADFHRPDFETIIQQKGRKVIIEKSLQCPCKGKSTNQQSNCKNCGGTGWIFVNPRETRLVLQGMNITQNYKAWSEEITGDLKVTASDTEELTFMDRFTILDAQARFTEVLFFKSKVVGGNEVKFAFTSYEPKTIEYMGYFTGTNNALQRLNAGVDYLVDKNIIKLINPAIVAVQGEISISIRYVHAPVYYMIDMKRESMESFEMFDGSEKLNHLPISGTARRSHYVLTAPNLTGDRLLNNSYIVSEIPVVYNSQQSIVIPPNSMPAKTIPISFTNQNSVLINHNLTRYVDVTVYDENGFVVDASIQRVDDNNVRVSFNSLQSGVIIVQ